MGRVDALPLADAYAAMDSKFWGAPGSPGPSASGPPGR